MTSGVTGSSPVGRSGKEINMEGKFYVVVRSDIDPGLLACQAVHAAIGWQAEHGEPPEVLALLEAPVAQIAATAVKAREAGMRLTIFREEDLGNELTAIALGPEARRITSSFPRALKRLRAA